MDPKSKFLRILCKTFGLHRGCHIRFFQIKKQTLPSNQTQKQTFLPLDVFGRVDFREDGENEERTFLRVFGWKRESEKKGLGPSVFSSKMERKLWRGI